MQSEKNRNTDRELKFSRLINAPVELVWKVWADPVHLNEWWGPVGVTNTIRTMDVRAGGDFDLTMHNTDGRNHDIQIKYLEVIPYEKIVYEQLNHFRCIATIFFEKRADQTYIDWTMRFESKEFLVECAKIYGVVTGLQETGEKLVQYVSALKNKQHENH